MNRLEGILYFVIESSVEGNATQSMIKTKRLFDYVISYYVLKCQTLLTVMFKMALFVDSYVFFFLFDS
jgi:hypothetical protein